MDYSINPERGEVALKIDDVELVLAAEMTNLAALSSALKCESMLELTRRMLGVEVNAVMAGIACLTISGNKEKALQKLRFKHFPACAMAFRTILSHHVDVEDASKKDEAAEENKTIEFPGGSGVNLHLAR